MKKIVAFVLCFVLVLSAVALSGCSSPSSGSGSPSSYSRTQNDGHLHTYNHRLSDDKYICQLCGKLYTGDPSNLVTTPPSSSSSSATQNPPSNSPDLSPSVTEEPAYADSRWPTTNSALLAIPESDRWYNARDKVGSYGTIAGPVVQVFQAKESAGMPVFIDIGAEYPSTSRVQIIIWGEVVPEFEEMLNQIDHGNAWVSFTGNIGEYNGAVQIDTSDGCSYTYWTGVK